MKDFDKTDDFDTTSLSGHESDNLSDQEFPATMQLNLGLQDWLLRKRIERRRDRELLRQMLEDYQHFTLDEITPTDTRH